ncbi:hypothetical protein D3Y59_14475 [Hymenobacter oligotrophus]|uniref:Uncharacterized protein n=1 Tax=Hymenobacter oligotrophus TaxID=2319843 RepID=A0A3B7RUZ2_9BACT|nr:hypothetical protein [Hymenobacter oligotrophus]AYA38137.1 hypothetical protein D3Y59_14475 [Hymenobacter oligotrophus]
MTKNRTNVPATPSHDDPARKKQEDQRPDTMKTSNRHPTPDKAHDPERNADPGLKSNQRNKR